MTDTLDRYRTNRTKDRAHSTEQNQKSCTYIARYLKEIRGHRGANVRGPPKTRACPLLEFSLIE